MYTQSGPLQKSLPAPDYSTREPVSTVGIFLSQTKLGGILIEKKVKENVRSVILSLWLSLLFRKAKTTAEACKF